MIKGPHRTSKRLALILLAVSGTILWYPAASTPFVLSLLPLPFLVASVVGSYTALLPLLVGLGLLSKKSWGTKLSTIYCLALMADGIVHFLLWFWTGGLIGPPYGSLAAIRVLEAAYLGSLSVKAGKEWAQNQ